MSIGVVCNLSDGVVLGVDSALTIWGTVNTPTGGTTPGVLNVYNECEKLFHPDGLKAGVLFAGLAMLGDRTLESYVREWEAGKSADLPETHTIQALAKSLEEFFSGVYHTTIIPAIEKETSQPFDELEDAQKPVLQIVVAGFSPDAYLSEVWAVVIPGNHTAAARSRGEFGTNWYGVTQSIMRLVKGYDPALIEALLDWMAHKTGLTRSEEIDREISAVLRPFEAMVPYNGMPIGTGVEHVRFLLDLVIGYTDFVVGAPVCGGRTRIATVTHEGFRWVAGHEPVIARLQADGVPQTRRS